MGKPKLNQLQQHLGGRGPQHVGPGNGGAAALGVSLAQLLGAGEAEVAPRP